jgi:hypothetical protein
MTARFAVRGSRFEWRVSDKTAQAELIRRNFVAPLIPSGA